jgi:hypothetical protein
VSSVTDRVVQHYAMTAADRAALTDLLAKAYLMAKVAAYRKAAVTASKVITLKHPWVPIPKDAAHAQAWAKAQVKSIADTYLATVKSLIDTQLATATTEGLIGGLINATALAKGITSGVKAFVEWKAPQIANVATNTGANAGTQQFIADALDEADDANGVRVRVVPDESSSDECAEYAGKDYSLEDSMDLPVFPIHPNCPHGLEVYTV